MSTESAKRKQTLGILDKLRSEGMPQAARYRNEWSGEELPPEEEGTQDEFEADKARRVEQSLANELPDGAYKDVYSAVQGVTGGVQPGATGMSQLTDEAPGMTPYSPEEFERRSSFGPIRTGVEALDQPLARSKRKKAEEGQSDEPVRINAAP